MHEVVVNAVAAAVMAATMTFNSTSQIFFLFIMLIYDLTIYYLRFDDLLFTIYLRFLLLYYF